MRDDALDVGSVKGGTAIEIPCPATSEVRPNNATGGFYVP